LKDENTSLQNKLNPEKKQNEELREKNEQLQNENNQLQIQRYKESELNEELQKKIQLLVNKDLELTSLRDKLTTAENERLKAENEKKVLQFTKSKTEAELQEREVQLQKMTSKFNVYAEENKCLQEVQEKIGYKDTPSSVDVDGFYDCVIDIPDIRSIASGWDLKVNSMYEKRKNNIGTIVSVVGNYSKGKTFLMELLSKKMFPHGFNVHTKGISVVYLGGNAETDDHTPVIGLDTKGGSNPLNISSLITQETPDEQFSAKLKEIFRDHQGTEDIIQNFILDQANVILVVVSDLTFDDQQLVNKIRKKFASVSRKKKVIVVHNLFHTQRVEDVQSKIHESILKSFSLTTLRYTTTIDGKNPNYYEDSTFKDFVIPHVILAKQDSKAGNFYNQTSIKFIQSCIESTGDQKSIDVIEALKSFLKSHLKSYIDVKEEISIQTVDTKMTLSLMTEPDEDKASREETPNEQANQEEEERKVEDKQKTLEIKMRPVSIDEFGFLKTLQGSFEPNYILSVSPIEGKPEKLYLQVECPGVDEDTLEFSIQTIDNQEYYIEIRGKINSEKTLASDQKRISNTTKQGLFCLKTEILRRANLNIDDDVCEDPVTEDGFLKLVFKIKEFAPFRKLMKKTNK